MCIITWNWHRLINTKVFLVASHYSVSVFSSEVITPSDIRGHDHEKCSYVLNFMSFHQLVGMSFLFCIRFSTGNVKVKTDCTLSGSFFDLRS